jgi:pimeloyl-ACP methyl ester carboxylesterase
MYLSVTCAEDIPFITEETARASSAGTRLGDYRLRQQMEACAEWPRAEGPHPSTTRPIDTPALVEAGAFDPATPLTQAEAAMRLLPNGRLVAVPHGGHGLAGLGIDACLVDIERRFIERGSASGLDTSCVAAARRPPFTLR